MLCRAIGAAEAAAPAMAALGSYQRKEVLEHCVAAFKDRFEDLAMSLCIEAGKPIKVCAGHTHSSTSAENPGSSNTALANSQPRTLNPKCRLELIPN